MDTRSTIVMNIYKMIGGEDCKKHILELEKIVKEEIASLSQLTIQCVSLLNEFDSKCNELSSDLKKSERTVMNQSATISEDKIKMEAQIEDIKDLTKTKQELTNENVHLKENVHRQEMEIENITLNRNNQHAQINSIVKILVNCMDVIDRTSYDDLYSEKTALDHLNTGLTSALKKVEVEPVDDVGKLFNPQWHTIENTKDTDDESKNNIICLSVKTGYRHKDTCVRRQDVIIYQYKQ